MSVINSGTTEKLFTIKKFAGLNESADGENNLDINEASSIINCRITKERNLKKRPGSKLWINLGDEPVMGMWYGLIKGRRTVLAACGGYLFKLDMADKTRERLGRIDTENRVNFFSFGGSVYMLNGKDYMVYDGTRLHSVNGYRPLIVVGAAPATGGGTLLEEINKLTGTRRVWYSPDGTATEYKLPEQNLESIDYVKNLVTEEILAETEYEVDLVNGKVTFDTAPTTGTNTIEIGYCAATSFRREVVRNRCAELFLGSTDNGVVLYGNGTNEFLYSSVDYDGQPRADYFPDLNEAAIGVANSPITAIVRHLSRLIIFKENEAYTAIFGTETTAEGLVKFTYNVTPINKEIGNIPLGQVCLIDNAPYTLCNGNIFYWVNSSYYTSNLTADERQARRMGDRVQETLKEFDFENAYCFDDNTEHEYYIVSGDRCLVYNYDKWDNKNTVNAWYTYRGLDIVCMLRVGSEMFYGDSHGNIQRFSSQYNSDNEVPFLCRYASGAINFNRPDMFKFINKLYVSIKPQGRGLVKVFCSTDKKVKSAEKGISTNVIDFADIVFGAETPDEQTKSNGFTFETNIMPSSKRLKIKCKKFTHWQIVLELESKDESFTVTEILVPVRFTGAAK